MKSKNTFYVYSHFHPETGVIVYIGMGQGDRAYRIKGNGKTNTYSDRHPDHAEYLERLIVDDGYLPHHWINFLGRDLTRADAFKLESQLIKKYNPAFNRKSGPKKLISEEQAKEIRTAYQDKSETYDTLAEKSNCSRTTIYRIIRNTRGIY